MNKYIHTALKGTLTAIMMMVGISVWAQEPEPKVAKIGETEYATLQAAIEATEDPTTITLLADITAQKEATITVGEGKNITLVINSYTIHSAITNSGTLAISDGSVSGSITNSGTITITGGTFTGTITNTNGTITISGGTFSTVDENFGNYLQSGYAVKKNSEEPATYSVVPQTSTTVNQSIIGDAKTAAEALAANTATNTPEGLAYNQSLEISIDNVTVEDGVVKTATFNVTPKDVNGATISSWSREVTFRLPITNTVAAGKWVNLKHNDTYIPASQVAEEGGNKYVTVTTTSFSPFSYYVLDNAVAKIGEQLYETVADAITAAPDATETTIVILADIATEITIPTEKNIKLTIGTHTISGAISNAGTLAISDGTISGNITNTGALYISGGAIEGTITKTEGTISITGGTFTNKPEAEWIAEDYEVMVGADNKFVVAATGIAEAQIGEVKYQTIADAIASVSTEAEAEATTIVVLKDITNDFTIVEGQKIALSVTSHTISGNISNAGTLAIADGTFIGTITNSGTLNISGGTFEGTVTNSGTQLYITGGTFFSKPSNYTCEADHELVVNNEGHYVVVLTSETEAQIKSEKYLTIGKAIEVAGSTATSITLLKDPTSTETITIPADANITLAISNGLSKPIANNGALTIESGTTTGNLTIMIATATIIIKEGVTHNGVQLDGSLGDYVLKTIDGTSMKTYRAEKRFTIQVDNGITDSDQRTAADDMAKNDALSTITGLGENQSIAITILSVTLTGGNATSAEFNVVLSGANGTAITTASNDITFRLPVSTGIDAGKWVNISNATEAIQGATVQAGKYIEITTKSFSNNSPNFKYSILNTEPVAQIGETKYETVAAAITAATSEQPIEILKDIDEVITVADSKTVTLAGGEYTLSGTITNSGALTLASGTFNGAITSNGGTITINGGSFSSSLTTDGGAIAIKGGTFAESCTFIETTDGIAISGGTFDVIPAVGVCATGYVPVKNGEGKFNMTNDWKMTDETAIGSIDYYASLGYTVATATYTRSVGMVGVGGNPAGTKYGTICLPFSITAKPEGVNALYKATGVTDSELTITEVTDFSPVIPAGTPLIFELTGVNTTMSIVSTSATINVAAPADPTDGNKLRGTYSEQNYTTELDSKYYLNGDKFHQAVNSLKVPAYRAYIHYEAPAGAPSFLNICKEGEGEDNTTGIQQIEALETVTDVYDLNGRKQNGLQRGINIVRRADGSTIKVIVK